MGFLVTAIAFVVIFSVLVLIHEFGHFYAAKRNGVKVEEFGIGLPPRIWGKKKGETLYSVNLIPFGGFVKLFGEDSGDLKLLKNKRSFASKSPRVRLWIVTAGVIMNLLLAWFLLTLGFTFGIRPLILDGGEVLAGINNGTIQIENGVVIKEIEEGSIAELKGLKPGDRIVAVNGLEIVSDQQLVFNEGEKAVMNVERDGQSFSVQVLLKEGEGTGFVTHEMLFIPRVVISGVKADSVSVEAGIQAGDVILQINNTPVYYMDDYESATRGLGSAEYMLLRDSEVVNVEVDLVQKEMVVFSTVFPGTPAEVAGFERGDVVVSVNGNVVDSPEALIAYAGASALKEMVYEVRRGGDVIEKKVTPNENGLIGVGLSTLRSFENDELSVYSTDFPVSVVKVDDVVYPFWIAPFKAVEETGRLSVFTLVMLVDVFESIATQFAVPEGVAGPVGIAQLTHTFVQEGVLSLLRFMALLSLSLAMLNILPFPALDGGRMLFILIEVVFGRRINARLESMIHAVGFLILMGLIFLITYNDILRLF